jgi:hypothetical protein
MPPCPASERPELHVGVRRLFANVAISGGTLVEVLLVVLGSTAVVCGMLRRVVEHFGSTVVGAPGSDSSGTIADLWQMRHESGFHLIGVTHHTLTGAPFGWDKTNALNLQTLLVYYPTYVLSRVIGDVSAFNVATFTGYVLSGATMYWLVRYLGCGRLVAAWAALAYIIFPWHVARAEHASLVHLEVLPLLLLTLLAVARRPTWTRFALVAVVNLVCWVTSGYFGPMAAVTTVAFAIGTAYVSGGRLRLIVGSTASALAPTVILGVAAVASGTNAGAGLERKPTELSIFGLRPSELVLPPARSRIFGDWLDSYWSTRMHGSNETEIANYLGLLTLALALVGLVVAVRRRKTLTPLVRIATAGLVSTFVAGLAFAAPSPVHLFGHPISTPSRLLWDVLPAFRVTSRWDALLMTAVLPIAALGLQAVAAWTAERYGRREIAAVVVAGAVAGSVVELSITSPISFQTVPVPSEYSALERTPDGIVAEYPLGYSDAFRFWQRQHGRPLLNGAPPGTPGDQARLGLLDPPASGTAEALSLLGVTAIGIHQGGANVDAENQLDRPPRDPVGVDGYRLIGRFPDGASIWQVVAKPAPALATLGGGFAMPGWRENSFVGSALVSPAGVGVIELAARRSGVVRLTFVADPPAGAPRVLRLADENGERPFRLRGRTPVQALVDVPRGTSRLLVKTDPAATSEADAIFLSSPRTEKSSSDPELRATLISADPGF